MINRITPCLYVFCSKQGDAGKWLEALRSYQRVEHEIDKIIAQQMSDPSYGSQKIQDLQEKLEQYAQIANDNNPDNKKPKSTNEKDRETWARIRT